MKLKTIAVTMTATALLALGTTAIARDGMMEADVFYYDSTGPFISAVSNYMKQYADYEHIVIHTHDGRNEVGEQEHQLQTVITKEKRPVIVNARDASVAAIAIEEAKNADVPIIFINREPGDDVLQIYDHAWFIGSKRRLAGIYQAQLLISYLKEHPHADRNGNGIIEYVLLKGEPNHGDTIARSAAFKDAMKLTGHKMHLLGEAFCNWRTEEAKQSFAEMIEKFGLENIEAVISNNDNMALGALAVLQKNNYNLGDNSHRGPSIPIIGVDGMPQALFAIASGQMTGTVQQDADGYARVAIKLLKQVGSDDYIDGLLINEEELGLAIGDDRRIMVPYSIVNQKRAAGILRHRDTANAERFNY